MNDNNGNVKELLRQVQNKLGRSLATPSDFDALLLAVMQTTGERMSISTIKRLVGYVNDSHEPSNATLSVLARYVGYRDWTDFTMQGTPVMRWKCNGGLTDIAGSSILETSDLK